MSETKTPTVTDLAAALRDLRDEYALGRTARLKPCAQRASLMAEALLLEHCPTLTTSVGPGSVAGHDGDRIKTWNTEVFGSEPHDTEDPVLSDLVEVRNHCFHIQTGDPDPKIDEKLALLAKRFEGSPPPEKPRLSHTGDFGSISLDDETWEFTGQARLIVQALFDAARKGDEGVLISRLGTDIGSDAERFRLEEPFRLKGSGQRPGFSRLIEKCGEGRARIRPEVAGIWRRESPSARK